jgi:S-adenosylmethionine hydrolase
MNIVSLLTDFGIKDGYVAQMKGVILSIANPRIIDISHEITTHNILEGAFVLRSVVNYFPKGTVNVAIVDPGVGSNRRGIIVTTRNQILIGPDNGVLIPAANLSGDFIVYEIINEKYMLNSISNTFHGRDIFSPVAAHIVNGVPFEEFGNRINDYIDLDFDVGKITNGSANGRIIYIDQFGNITTNIEGNVLKRIIDHGKKITLFIGNKKHELLFVKSYSFVKNKQILVTIGSNNLVEIAVNQGNAAKKLNIKVNDEIKILFK